MTTANHAALLFAIGPVQAFIATARKGQDFWFGSWLLSELSLEAASAAKTQGAELVLPNPASLECRDAIANKVVARVRSSDVDRVARAMEEAVRNRLAALAGRVFDRIQSTKEGVHLHRKHAEQQVADLLEIYWVTVNEVVMNGHPSWGPTRKRAEAALAARKALRNFGPVTWGAPVPKSRLDGYRESVIDEAAFTGPEGNRAERLRQSFGIGPAERLCGVGLLKRNGHRVLPQEDTRGARVISTAHVASWSLRRAWATPDVHGSLVDVFRSFTADLPDQGSELPTVPRVHADPVLDRFDGQILFSNRLAELYEGQNLVAARSALETFLKKARDIVEAKNGRWPVLSSYYSVLRADGDRLGEWLDNLSHSEEHRLASEGLAAFARAAEKTITEHHGHCIFAGGDDVLALVPVATVLSCAAALNVEFGRALSKGPKTTRNLPTLSAGIQIAHASEPFRGVLDGAKGAEHEAKHTYGRAAFAIRLEKRGGPALLVGGKWEELESLRTLQRLQEPGADAIPRGLAYDLRRVADGLRGASRRFANEGSEAPELARIRALEVDRVLGQKEVAEPATRAIWARLGTREIDDHRLRRLCDELTVARALAGLDGDAP